MTTLRDLLLNENADTVLTAAETGVVSSEIVPTSRPVDARYTWIEAEIERYDDLRKPLALPTPVADPKPKVVEA
jgi:hypothetical protein